MMAVMSGMVHLFVRGADPVGAPLLLLHGTGGTERDLLPVAGELAPAASALAVRGSVEIDGGFAFFRRHPDRTIDEADITARATSLAAFITACRHDHGLSAPVAVGFSNGAIMAAALLLMRPGLLRSAILFRPLSPLSRELSTTMQPTPVLILDGRNDTRRSHGDGLRLAQRLERAGAVVTHDVLDTGHGITSEDVAIARAWLAKRADEARGR
ncbi:alpha/beta hydrolase [Bradyrhizobium sp. USDA 4353]